MNDILALLTITAGSAIHLAPPVGKPGRGRGALDDYYFTDGKKYAGPNLENYDQEALAEPRWSSKTLCGREWSTMIGGDGGGIGTYGQTAFAPTCRRCLSLMDHHFPPPKIDPRLNIVAQIAANTVVDGRGFVEIHHVPGDHRDELRKVIRRLIRKRTSESVRTYSAHDVVYASCRAIMDGHFRELAHEAGQALESHLAGNAPPRLEDREWVIMWGAWDVA